MQHAKQAHEHVSEAGQFEPLHKEDAPLVQQLELVVLDGGEVERAPAHLFNEVAGDVLDLLRLYHPFQDVVVLEKELARLLACASCPRCLPYLGYLTFHSPLLLLGDGLQLAGPFPRLQLFRVLIVRFLVELQQWANAGLAPALFGLLGEVGFLDLDQVAVGRLGQIAVG